MFPELADLEAARVALQARLATIYPDVQVSITIQLLQDETTITVIARDHGAEGAPIVWGAGDPFPGVPTILSWIQWLATAPV